MKPQCPACRGLTRKGKECIDSAAASKTVAFAYSALIHVVRWNLKNTIPKLTLEGLQIFGLTGPLIFSVKYIKQGPEWNLKWNISGLKLSVNIVDQIRFYFFWTRSGFSKFEIGSCKLKNSSWENIQKLNLVCVISLPNIQIISGFKRRATGFSGRDYFIFV